MAAHANTIGIVTISFNQAKFLPECIESVQLSNNDVLRYVIVDPGSKDGSRDVIMKYHDRFSAIVFEADDGPADGLNKGFSRCDADILGYLNSDDRFAPGALEYVLHFFEANPNVDVIMGAIKIIDEQGREAPRKRISWQFNPQSYLEGTCLTLQQGTFFRRSAWEKTQGFNVDNFTCWDTELIIDMALTGSKFQTVNKVLGEFRVHSASITGSQRLTQKYLVDQTRLRTKISDAGFDPGSVLSIKAKQFAFKANPVRRILEWVVR